MKRIATDICMISLRYAYVIKSKLNWLFVESLYYYVSTCVLNENRFISSWVYFFYGDAAKRFFTALNIK